MSTFIWWCQFLVAHCDTPVTCLLPASSRHLSLFDNSSPPAVLPSLHHTRVVLAVGPEHCPVQSNVTSWAWGLLKLMIFPFLVEKNVKLTNGDCQESYIRIWMFLSTRYIIHIATKEHAVFTKFLWEFSPKSEMMLLNLLMLPFGKQKGVWFLVP